MISSCLSFLIQKMGIVTIFTSFPGGSVVENQLAMQETWVRFLSSLEKLGQNCDERNPKQNKGHTHAHTSLWKQLLCVKMITASERLSLASIASSLVSLSNQ